MYSIVYVESPFDCVNRYWFPENQLHYHIGEYKHYRIFNQDGSILSESNGFQEYILNWIAYEPNIRSQRAEPQNTHETEETTTTGD